MIWALIFPVKKEGTLQIVQNHSLYGGESAWHVPDQGGVPLIWRQNPIWLNQS